jgi:hypothetical protein
MPKILINEKDRTSPGTPGSYANYSVLIAGYKGTPSTKMDAMIIEPDSNGVYEFSSKQAFEDTIGLVDVEKTVEGVAECHYGNRMAYELLNLGYTIVYKPIESIQDMNTETFWEDFKDKASYDFRFISHGLLETNHEDDTYKTFVARLAQVDADIAKLAEITKTVEETEGFEAKSDTEKDEAYQAEYRKYIKVGSVEPEFKKEDGTLWFTDSTGQLSYGTYALAKEQFTANADNVIPAKAAAEAAIVAADEASVTPGTFNNINSHIAKLASYRTDDKGTVFCGGRGDCTALIELYENCYVNTIGTTRNPEQLIIAGINGMSSSIGDDGEYCAMTVPSVYYTMSDAPVKFPGAFHYLACFMSSLGAGFAEWYAAAGYTRGVSSYAIDHTSVKLGEIAINALEPRQSSANGPKFACNVIANFRGSYYLWGNRTAAPLKETDLTAKHFLNIRQLSTTLKKQLYVACRRFTFDPNSDTLWFNFVNAIAPTLDGMKADQGVRDYKILKVFTDKKATLKAKIRIIPIEAVEDFDIEVSLEDSFGGVSVAIN